MGQITLHKVSPLRRPQAMEALLAKPNAVILKCALERRFFIRLLDVAMGGREAGFEQYSLFYRNDERDVSFACQSAGGKAIETYAEDQASCVYSLLPIRPLNP
jgi:hypothetical protein